MQKIRKTMHRKENRELVVGICGKASDMQSGLPTFEQIL